jgi:NYN domain
MRVVFFAASDYGGISFFPADGPSGLSGGVFTMFTHSDRVAVFIDWQNVYKGAREAFGMVWQPSEHGNFSPYRLAQILAAGNDRGPDGKLVLVEIHRGLPSSTRDPVGFAANRRQSAAWMKECPELVVPRPRPLRYPDDDREDPDEKGIDVQLALSAVENALSADCEVVVIFSHDTDLRPAIETISRIAGESRVETAGWTSPTFHKRLGTKPDVFHHAIPGSLFRSVETPINYAYRGIRTN